MFTDISLLCASPETSVKELIAMIERAQKGIMLITDPERRLLGTVTDGDIRRAILSGQSMSASVHDLLIGKKAHIPFKPITMPLGTEPADLLRMMKEKGIHHIPLLNDEGRVTDLVMLKDFLPSRKGGMQAVIMAGGMGTRLRPLTDNVPKPMLPVGERPLAELIIEKLRDAGIRRVNISTHYMPEKIKDHFRNGIGFGVDVTYTNEDRPLGTAGALGLIDPPTEPLLVINGDILTGVDFQAMMEFHQQHRAALTIAVRKYELDVPYGVVATEGAYVTELQEKPLYQFFVNAGIYLLEPSVHNLIPRGEHMDMPELIKRILERRHVVVSFPIHEYWLDIGKPDDYLKAQQDIEQKRRSTKFH
jgi:dTDP-glucose pyrophosphorylase/CBS domain-containing protein